MSSRFGGDIKLFLDEDGAYFIWVNGQPIQDKGLENLILVSLFTYNDDYWGNYLEDDENEKLGSLFITDNEYTITFDSLNTRRSNAEKDLKFITDLGIAKEINVKITSPTYNGFKITIEVVSHEDKEIIEILGYADKWYNQYNDPAYLKDR